MTLEKRLELFLQNNKHLICRNEDEDNCFYKYSHVVIK